MWTRKPTIIDGRLQPEDWTILRRGQRVGRVFRMPGALAGTPPFQWAVFVTIASGPMHGREVDLQTALDALRQTIQAHWPDSAGVLPAPGTR